MRTVFRDFCAMAAILAIVAPASASPQASPRISKFVPASTVRSLERQPVVVRFGEELEFDWIVDVVPVRNGGLVVANSGTASLHFFDRAGRVLRSVGRRGSGPGEYQDIGGVTSLPGDSLIVWDGMLRRATVLSPAGEFIRAFPLEAPFDGGGSVTRLVALRGGRILIGFSEVTTLAPSPKATVFGERVISFDTNGRRTGEIDLRLVSSDHFVQAVPAEMGGVAYWGLAFGRDLTVRATALGFVTGDGTQWGVEVRSFPRGEVRERYEIDRLPVEVTAAAIAAFRERALSGEKGPSRVVAERMVAEMPFPRTQPAYVRFEIDERNRVWIEDYLERRTDTPLWYRMDPTAARADAVRFAPRFTPRAFANGLAYGIWRDQDDVQHVVAYAVDGVP